MNYSQLNGGQPGVALRELTGMPVVTYNSQKQSGAKFFEIVTRADKKNWVMAGACMHPHASLVTGHAYTILGTVQLKGGPKLIKLRNPWGREKYAGPFRDDDPKWNTHGWAKQVGLTKANDGIFYIPLKDFKISFTHYSILMYQKWHTQRKNIKGKGKKFNTSITSKADQEIVITLDYQNKRQVPRGCKMPNVFYNFYIYGEIPGKGPKPTPVSRQTGYGSHSFIAKAGKKHRLLIINWANAGEESNFVLTSYGEKANVVFG